MFDPKALLDQVLGGVGPDGQRKGMSPEMVKGLAGGAALGGLAGILLGGKGAKKLAKTALKVGGTAALAGLAYKAYNDWQAAKSGSAPTPGNDRPPPAEGTAFLPAIPKARDDLSLSLLRAMIAAAKADGHIDGKEQQAIFAKLDEEWKSFKWPTWLKVDTEKKAITIESEPVTDMTELLFDVRAVLEFYTR